MQVSADRQILAETDHIGEHDVVEIRHHPKVIDRVAIIAAMKMPPGATN